MTQAESSYESVYSDSAQRAAIQLATRGRGRPSTTGQSELYKKCRTLKEKVRIIETIRGINNPELEPKTTRSMKQLLKSLAPTMEDIRQAPLPDVFARVLEEANKVIKLADGSGNLKGVFQRGFKESALLIRSAASTISMRTQQEENMEDRERELEELRSELRNSREERDRLQETIRSLQNERTNILLQQAREKVVSPPLLKNAETSPIAKPKMKPKPKKASVTRKRSRVIYTSSSEEDTQQNTRATTHRPQTGGPTTSHSMRRGRRRDRGT